MAEPVKHPATAMMAAEALRASGCKTHQEFIALTGGAISLRSFRYWLKGERPAGGVEWLVLSQIAKGWRPQL